MEKPSRIGTANRMHAVCAKTFAGQDRLAVFDAVVSLLAETMIGVVDVPELQQMMLEEVRELIDRIERGDAPAAHDFTGGKPF